MYRYSEQLPASGHLYTEPLGLGMNYLGLQQMWIVIVRFRTWEDL